MKKENEYCFPSYELNEIKEAFDSFDINRNGYIGVAELKEIFSIINEEVSDEELDEMIGLADKEGDGQVNWLNFYEFITGNAADEEIRKILEQDEDEEEDERKEGMIKPIQNAKIIGDLTRKGRKKGNLDFLKRDSDPGPTHDHEPDSDSGPHGLKTYNTNFIPIKDSNKSSRDHNEVTIKVHKKKNIVIKNQKDENSNPSQDDNNENDDIKADNFIRDMLKKNKKNQFNENNRVKLIDIDKAAPKPKLITINNNSEDSSSSSQGKKNANQDQGLIKEFDKKELTKEVSESIDEDKKEDNSKKKSDKTSDEISGRSNFVVFHRIKDGSVESEKERKNSKEKYKSVGSNEESDISKKNKTNSVVAYSYT